MKTTISGNGVKVAKTQKVVSEMIEFINSKGSFLTKKKEIWNINTAGRAGKDIADRLRIDYIHKFDYYTTRNILGSIPRGIEMYGHKFVDDYSGKFIKRKPLWEERFANYLEKLYEDNLDYTFHKTFYGYQFKDKRNLANEIRNEHLATIEKLKPESERIIKNRNYEMEKARSTKYDLELSNYLEDNFPYRVATGKWAGGETDIKVYKRPAMYETEAFGESFTAWSKNQKWRGLNVEYKFYVKEDETLIVIGGLATVYKIKDEKENVKPCIWWEQSIGFNLRKKEGWLVGGYHSEAKTKEAAIKGAKQSKNYLINKDNFLLTKDYVHKKFGFCYAGINNFMKVNNITQENLTVAELRNIVVKNRELNYKVYRSHLLRIGIVLNGK